MPMKLVFKGADSDTESLIWRTNFKKQNDMAVKEQHQAKISGRCAALENLMMMMTTTTVWTSVVLGEILEYKSFNHRESRLL
jgi:hypothetical protein